MRSTLQRRACTPALVHGRGRNAALPWWCARAGGPAWAQPAAAVSGSARLRAQAAGGSSPLQQRPRPADPAQAPPQQKQQQPAQLQRGGAAGAAGVCRRKALPMGWKKIEFVLPLARRRYVDDALRQLAACPKRAAVAVHHAVANARNNAIAQGADPARLVVERVWTGRATPFKKPWFHGRGYSSIRQRRRTNLWVVVQEAAQAPAVASPPAAAAPARTAGPAAAVAEVDAIAPRPPRPAQLVAPAMLRPRRERRFPRPQWPPV